MCVAVPMKVQSIAEDMCVAEMGGVSREVSLIMLPDVHIGDYIIVHAGFAIEKLNEDEARRTLELFRELGELMDEGEQASDE